MTSRLLTPWWRNRRPGKPSSRAVHSGVAETAILDWRSSAVQALLTDLDRLQSYDPRDRLRSAHGLVAATVRAVYSIDEAQAVSRTLARGRGSCSQRLAVLEAVARASGIPTRVHGLLIDGSFWYPRFRKVRFIVPDAVVLAWPEFLMNAEWVSVAELFGPVGSLSMAGGGFTNADGETLFDAVARTAVDWEGRTSQPGSCSACDLSAAVRTDLGRYDSRDELFAAQGQTLCWLARMLAEPVFARLTAGVAAQPRV